MDIRKSRATLFPSGHWSYGILKRLKVKASFISFFTGVYNKYCNHRCELARKGFVKSRYDACIYMLRIFNNNNAKTGLDCHFKMDGFVPSVVFEQTRRRSYCVPMFVFAVSMRRLITFSSGKPSSAFQPTNKAKLMLLIIRGKNFLLGQTTNQLNNWLESPR